MQSRGSLKKMSFEDSFENSFVEVEEDHEGPFPILLRQEGPIRTYQINNDKIMFVPSLLLTSYMKDGINRVNQGCNFGEVIFRNNTAYLFYLTQNIIVASLRLDFYLDFVEIYDVCTLAAYRGKGYMKTLLKLLQDLDSQYKTLWLGVRTDAADRDLIIKLYSKAGFKTEKYRNETYASLPKDFTFFGMTRNNDTKKGRPLYDMLDDLQENISVRIAYETLRTIYYKFSEGQSLEFSGPFNAVKEGNQITLGYSNSFIRANPEAPYNVIIPEARFSWHTHPAVCYRDFKCAVGWPSGLDMAFIFSSYLIGLMQHFVFTEEGLYIVHLSYPAMKFVHMIAMNREWLDSVTTVIKDKFASIEERRKNPRFLANFLEAANTRNLESYIALRNEDKTKQDVRDALHYFEDESQESDFPLFVVNFYPGTTFYTAGYVTNTFSYLPSPYRN